MSSNGKSGNGSALISGEVVVEVEVEVIVVSNVVFFLFLLALGVAWFSSDGVGLWFLDGLGVENADENSSSSMRIISSGI